MKPYKKILISAAVGLLAMALYSAPMWWGVLFSAIARDLACAPAALQEEGLFWSWGDVVLRCKSLDLLLALFGGL